MMPSSQGLSNPIIDINTFFTHFYELGSFTIKISYIVDLKKCAGNMMSDWMDACNDWKFPDQHQISTTFPPWLQGRPWPEIVDSFTSRRPRSLVFPYLLSIFKQTKSNPGELHSDDHLVLGWKLALQEVNVENTLCFNSDRDAAKSCRLQRI